LQHPIFIDNSYITCTKPTIHEFRRCQFILVKSGGEWISSVELEGLIMGHPKVLEACVVGIPDARWSERPLACVVAKPDYVGKVTKEEILDFLRPQVAKWWLPDDVVFIDAVPKTSVGKFDKKVLRSKYEMHSSVKPS
jgi:fatty-acyl-CoA synthase